jgi:hypothetical protein
LSDIVRNFKYFTKFLEKGGYCVVEDYNHTKYFKYLNNANNELLFDMVIKKIKNKILFSSEILKKMIKNFFTKT